MFHLMRLIARGPYATSIQYHYAINLANDFILAYDMNGYPLSPDHGYPIWSIIPGTYPIHLDFPDSR